MSLRRLWVLVSRLPRESHVARGRLGEYAHWDPTFHRLTDIADLLLMANWQRGGDENAVKPDPIPRPGADQAGPQDKHLTPEEFDSLFD